MFNVTFYNFSKRYNSTKRPASGNGTTYSCRVLDGTAIINPKIVLDIGLTADPSKYNYAYIPNFDRYYHIREWTFDRGLWIANMNVDVLATYKTQIGNANLYVLRASNDYDGTIIDNKYPTKTGCTFNKTTITSPYIGGESFILGATSKLGLFGSNAYFVSPRADIAKVCDYLIDDTVTESNGFSWNDASQALQLSLVDPVQYIKSCIWLPFTSSDFVTIPLLTGVQIFKWNIPNTGDSKRILVPTISKNYTFSIPKHPDTNARGNYVNCAPYTIATLSFPPFGVIEIDTSVLCNASTLNVNLTVDAMSGKGFLTLKANNIILNRVEAQIGMPIQLSQVTRDYIGAAQSVLGGVNSIVGGAISGGPLGIAGAITGGLSAIGNAAQALAPRSNTVGGGGTMSHLRGDFELDFQFFRPVADDLAQNGRPLCQKRNPKNLGGYMLIQDGDVATSGTQAENEQIQALLESGFYYE